MKVWVWAWAGLALSIVSASEAVGQEITIDEFLDRVSRTHPFMAREALQVDIETARRDRFLGRTDWHLNADAAIAYEKPLQTSAFAPKSVTAWSTGVDLGRLLWGAGSRLSMGWSSTVSDQDLPAISIPGPGGPIEVPVGPSTFYEQKVFVSYVQPLLQNRGGKLDRIEYELGEFNVRAARVESMENQEGFLLDAAIRFVDWALLDEQIRILERRRSYEEEQLQRTTRQRRANLVDEVDVLRGRDALKGAEERVVFAQSAFKSKQAELSVIAQSSELYDRSPGHDIHRVEMLPEIEEAVERLDNGRILRLLKVRHEQLAREREGLAETKKPQLSLSLTAALQKGNTDFADSWTLDDPNLAAALGFSHPVKNRTAEADFLQTELEIRQLEKSMQGARLDLEARLRAIFIAIAELEKVLALNKERIDTALKRTREEERLYELGRNELQFVIQSRDQAAIAELTYAINAADYQKLVLQYRALMDELLAGP